ncbi:alpha/beta-hydrolase [Ophiobolus disseminans]|uniref:Carboxylic ester hydrolase n=1 Tax=Ophiobolus disseminans TaxID=1469910 RepID=A0A6A7ACZ8_9PLEO|nr:alpha/beta-hydrolase [Ophiobolus disseminans]
MSALLKAFATCVLVLSGATAVPVNNKNLDLTVDLGYVSYKGYQDAATSLSVWKGIRYAAPPVNSLRWKEPRRPEKTRTIYNATAFGPNCPQAYPAVPNAPFVPGNEDCLFLNVYAPSDAEDLPVLVWIHGGGYGFGDGTQDMSEIIAANKNGFVAVTIQYRLGAFGFLSSSEVESKGVVNAGILDMAFALDWVDDHIEKFGGDCSKVTIAGESAGAGAVMLLSIAENGGLGTSLFRNSIAASPYLPAQYDYDAAIPTQRYRDFASQAGCAGTPDVLACLRKKDSTTLQRANIAVTSAGVYGTWAFLPVTDSSFIKSRPSTALLQKRVNGKNILVGNNANEGALFVPPTIKTLDDLKAWLRLEFPTFTADDIQRVLDAYPSSGEAVNTLAPKFATNGLGPATAVNVSQVATGQQQRANNILAEATFVCPSYWLNGAYSGSSRSSYHYQYSVPFASHADDITGYFGPATPNQSASFALAFRQLWGNFIKTGNPSVSTDPALSKFPAWGTGPGYKMVNLNTTGGTPYQATTQFGATVIQFREPGLQNDFDSADAYAWEGGRGKRCEFWASVAGKVSI